MQQLASIPVLSIIVPVYNKENYIDRCIQSILVQNFTDFELILVNDGSTDRSGEKCNEHQKMDSRVLVFHQENKGVSAARNLGIEKARGQYVGFVDADDWITPDMYSFLINNARIHQADISICGTIKSRQLEIPNWVQGEAEIYNGRQETLSAFFNEKLGMGVVNKIYRSEKLKTVRFAGSMFEDAVFIFKTLLDDSRVILSPQIKYIIVSSDNSVSISAFGPKYFQITRATKEMVELTRQNAPEVIEDAKLLDFVMNLSQLNLLLLSDKRRYKSEYDQTTSRLMDYRSFVRSNRKIKRKHRTAYYFFRISPALYSKTMELYCLATGRNVIKRTRGNAVLTKTFQY